ncbi:MAG: DnaD domain protein [Clostridia bacterium]|nr:DnaD domain protein [Clostridia bacterium]
MIKCTSDYRGGAVAVPTEVIDRCLKLAPAASFKVLLYVLRNPGGCEIADAAAGTGLAEADVRACVDYWQRQNVLTDDGAAMSDEQKKALSAPALAGLEPADARRSVRTLPVKKPTQGEIAARLAEEPALGTLCREAQKILGTFGYDTQAVLVMVHDFYGFSPEMILSMLQFQKAEGRASSGAIRARAEDWAARGIDSMEQVETELLALEKARRVYGELRKIPALELPEKPTPRTEKRLREWAGDGGFSAEMIAFALTESGNSLSEAGKKLRKWAAQGLTDPAQVKAKQAKSIATEVKPSYTADGGAGRLLERARRYAAETEETK